MKKLSADDQILFSHSDPASRSTTIHRNTWSPSQWHAITVPNERSQSYEPVESVRELVLFFETDADQLARPELDRFLKFMNLVNLAKEQRYLLVGHTDTRFTTSHNQTLSERRAATVLRHLVAYGVDQRKINVKARGPQEPASNNETELGRAQNRRVTLHISE